MSNLTDQLRDRARALNPGPGRTTTMVQVGDPAVLADLLAEAATKIESYEREGVAGRMHSVDRAFYNLTVLQRDSAWRELEAIREATETLRGQIGGPR